MSDHHLQRAHDTFEDLVNSFVQLHESAQYDSERIDDVLLRLFLIERGPGARLFSAPPATDAEVDLWIKEVGLVLSRVGNLYKDCALSDRALWQGVKQGHEAFFHHIRHYKRAKQQAPISNEVGSQPLFIR